MVVTIVLDGNLLKALDEVRNQFQPIPSRSEMIGNLLWKGLYELKEWPIPKRLTKKQRDTQMEEMWVYGTNLVHDPIPEDVTELGETKEEK
jgi:hypothetical protein